MFMLMIVNTNTDDDATVYTHTLFSLSFNYYSSQLKNIHFFIYFYKMVYELKNL